MSNQHSIFNTLRTGLIQAVQKNCSFARGFADEYLRSCSL